MENTLLRRSVAEGIGVFVLVLAGCGAIIVDAQTGALGHIGIAFTFGLAITVMVAATGHVSGGHINPAVTVAFAVTRHFPWREVPFYALGQFAGGLLAALALQLLFGNVEGAVAIGATVPSGEALQSLGAEILATAALMFVITSVATDSRASGQTAAFAIGATIALGALWAGPVSGASMNPARSFGPALISGVWVEHWVYWIGPLVGASLGALGYQFIRQPQTAPDAAATTTP